MCLAFSKSSLESWKEFTLVDEVEDVGVGCWQGKRMSSFNMFKISGRLGHLKQLLSLILSMKLRMM